MFHQQRGAFQCFFQGLDLLFEQEGLGLACLAGDQSVVDFAAGIQQGLLERQACFFLLCFGDAVLGHDLSFIEQRLCE